MCDHMCVINTQLPLMFVKKGFSEFRELLSSSIAVSAFSGILRDFGEYINKRANHLISLSTFDWL